MKKTVIVMLVLMLSGCTSMVLKGSKQIISDRDDRKISQIGNWEAWNERKLLSAGAGIVDAGWMLGTAYLGQRLHDHEKGQGSDSGGGGYPEINITGDNNDSDFDFVNVYGDNNRGWTGNVGE